jgi:hypothetical protein
MENTGEVMLFFNKYSFMETSIRFGQQGMLSSRKTTHRALSYQAAFKWTVSRAPFDIFWHERIRMKG